MVGLSLYHVKVFVQVARTFSCRIVDFAIVNMHRKICWWCFFLYRLHKKNCTKNFIIFCAKCWIYKFWKIWEGMERYSWYFYTGSKILIVVVHISLHVIHFSIGSKIFIVFYRFQFFHRSTTRVFLYTF